MSKLNDSTVINEIKRYYFFLYFQITSTSDVVNAVAVKNLEFQTKHLDSIYIEVTFISTDSTRDFVRVEGKNVKN